MSAEGKSGGGIGDIGLVFLRLAGLAFAKHGFDKIFRSEPVSMEAFAESVGKLGFPVPVVFAWAAALSEFVGGACVAAGFLTRFAAVFCSVTMFVAVFMAHATDPLAKRELPILYLLIMIGLAFLGGGRWSVDGMRKKG